MDAGSETLVDFHTHSHFSDGVLAPAQLVERARARGVSTLALTDHDTTAGLDAARAACEAASMRFVPGVELSANWRGQTIHIVGLEIDERHGGMQAHLSRVLERRQARLGEIGERLEKRARLPGRELAAAAATCAAPTRLHLARQLVARGFARDTQEAFDRWLNRNTPGHVPAEWPSLESAMAVLRESGSIAVMAHPHRYRLSGGQLREADRGIRAARRRGTRSQHGRHEPERRGPDCLVMPALQTARIHGFGLPRSGGAVESPRPLA